MKTASRIAIRVPLCAILSVGVAAAQNILYVSPAITGRVVGESGRPLAGASVLAFWRDSREPDSLLSIRTIHAVEATTGPEGSFTIAAWELKTLQGPVSSESPVLLCYATGHQLASLRAGDVARSGRQAEIRMRPLSDVEPERVKQFRETVNTLMLVWAPLRGERNPGMLLAIAADWPSAPEELRRQAPALIPLFEQALQELRAGAGG